MKKIVLFFLIAFSLNTSAQSALMGNFQRNQWVGADTDNSMELNISEITDKTDMACCFNGNAMLHSKYRLPKISTLSSSAILTALPTIIPTSSCGEVTTIIPLKGSD